MHAAHIRAALLHSSYTYAAHVLQAQCCYQACMLHTEKLKQRHICAYEGCMCAQESMPHVCILLYAIHAQWHVCHS